MPRAADHGLIPGIRPRVEPITGASLRAPLSALEVFLAGPTRSVSHVLIDRALQDSGWNLLNTQQVRFELRSATGRADYVLSGFRGPLGVDMKTDLVIKGIFGYGHDSSP